MKVSRREFIMLIVLLVAGIGYFLYAFLFGPALSDIEAASDALSERRTALYNYERTLANNDLATLQAEQQTRIDDIEAKAAPLLPYIDYSQLTAFLDGIAKSQGVSIYAVAITEEALYDTAETEAAGELLTYPLQESAALFRGDNSEGGDAAPEVPETGAGTGSTAVVNRLVVGVQMVNVTYPQILGFIKQLESYGRAIYLESISISNDDTGANLSAALTYGFMQADKLTDTDKGLAQVAPAENTGKSNPFSSGTAQIPQAQETNEPQNTQTEQTAG